MTMDQFVKLAAIKDSGAAAPKLSVRKKKDGKFWIVGGDEPQGPYDTKQEAQVDKEGILNFFNDAAPQETEPDLAEADFVKKVGRGKGSLDVVQTSDGLFHIEGTNGNYGPYTTVEEAVEQAKFLRTANGKSPKPNLRLVEADSTKKTSQAKQPRQKEPRRDSSDLVKALVAFVSANAGCTKMAAVKHLYPDHPKGKSYSYAVVNSAIAQGKVVAKREGMKYTLSVVGDKPAPKRRSRKK